MTATRRIQILIGLVPMLLITFFPLRTWSAATINLGGLWGGEVVFWALAAILLLYIALVERRPFSSVGFRRPGFPYPVSVRRPSGPAGNGAVAGTLLSSPDDSAGSLRGGG